MAVCRTFDTRACELGEGAFWHPLRQEFFWFDILGCKLLSRRAHTSHVWPLGQMASAAGWLDAAHVLLATEAGLAVLDLDTGQLLPHWHLPASATALRSNDGRADRDHGFWFSTMGKLAEPGVGAIYRYFRGEVRQLFEGLTIPNSICFSPDGRQAYFSDTARQIVWRQALDALGWPTGERVVFLDLVAEGLNPDGAVVDTEGGLWCAHWGAGAVMRYSPEAQRTHTFSVGGALHVSCPAFGGPDLRCLLLATAREGMRDPDCAQGITYLLDIPIQGLPEPRVIL
ncbi:MAG: SMP-30/gluconolactonase/LRE family protein [Candidimonas sp.]|nr:SMP-30/gluconolactonase/LRE family protein [Candidimonas sp.]